MKYYIFKPSQLAPLLGDLFKVRQGYITIYASKGISAEVWKKPETTPKQKKLICLSLV
jgi:hypothetical protein